MNYSLGKLQRIFVRKIADLIKFAYDKGFELSFSEAWRPPETAALYKRQGRGISNSLHCDRLAVDFNLFQNGKYCSSTEAHKELGEYWESLGEPGVKTCWGGRFGDGNHYSIEYKGRK